MSNPDADVQAHLDAIATERLWDDEIGALVDYGFSSVSRNPSDYETAVAYRRAIASVLHHMRNGWAWEYGSFMGHRGWMWTRPAKGDRSPKGQDAEERLDAEHESAVRDSECARKGS